MRILLFGASGRLGRRILAKLMSGPKHWEINFPKHTQMPVESSIVPDYIRRMRPNLIINASAMNGLEACRDNPRQAVETNCMAVSTLTTEAMSLGAGFIHFSTDYAEPAVDVYGATKFAGEKLALLYDKTAVFRLMSIYDPRDMAGSLSPVRDVLNGKATGESPAKVLYQITAPTFTGWVADVIFNYIEKKMWLRPGGLETNGLFHLAPYGQTSKLHFAQEAIDLFVGKLGHQRVTEANELTIKRPAYSVFETKDWQHTQWLLNHLKIQSPSIRDNLEQAHQVWQTENHAGADQSASNRS